MGPTKPSRDTSGFSTPRNCSEALTPRALVSVAEPESSFLRVVAFSGYPDAGERFCSRGNPPSVNACIREFFYRLDLVSFGSQLFRYACFPAFLAVFHPGYQNRIPPARVETANHQSRDVRPHRAHKPVLDGSEPPSEASPMSMICRKSKIRFGIAGSLVMVKYQILQPEFPYILFNNRRLEIISRIHFKNRQ